MRGYEELQRNLQQEIIGLLQRNRELAKLAEERQEKEGAGDSEKQKPQVQLDSPEGPISPEASQIVTQVMLQSKDDSDDLDRNWDPNHEPLSGIEVHHVNGAKQPPTNSGTVNGHSSTPSSLSKTQSSIDSSSLKDPKASVGHTMQNVPNSNHSTSSSSSTSSSNIKSTQGPDGDNSPPGIRITDSIKLLTHPVQPTVNQGVAAAVAPAAALAGITVAPAVALVTQSNPHAAGISQSTEPKSSSPSSSTTMSENPGDDAAEPKDSDLATKSNTIGASVVGQQQQTSAIGDESIPDETSKSTTEQSSILEEIREMGDKQKRNADTELRESDDIPEIFTEENPAYSSPSRDMASLANGLVPPSSLATTTHYTEEGTASPRQMGRYMGRFKGQYPTQSLSIWQN